MQSGNSIPLFIIFNCYGSTFSVQCFTCSKSDGLEQRGRRTRPQAELGRFGVRSVQGVPPSYETLSGRVGVLHSDAPSQVREPNYLVLLPSTYCTLRIRVRRHNYLADALGPSASEMLIPMITAFRAAPPSPTITLIAQSHVHSRSGQLIIGCFYLADQHMIISTPSVQLYTWLTLAC